MRLLDSLPGESSEYVQDLQGTGLQDIDGQAGDSDIERRWWVLHTRSRQEKALATELLRQRIPYYLPLTTRFRYYGSRVVTVRYPLFGGYLFLRGTPEERLAVLRTKRIARVLPVVDQVGLTDELMRIRAVVDSGEPLSVIAGLKEGRSCEVICGPLKGVRGVVLRRSGRTRVYVGVEMLGQSAVVEIDGAMLVALN